MTETEQIRQLHRRQKLSYEFQFDTLNGSGLPIGPCQCTICSEPDKSIIRAAYADPPYIGQAKKHYSNDPRCAEVDHAELIKQLNTFDAWALSCSSPSLKQILSMCPDDVRVMAWVKPFCAFKANVNPAYAWEPIIVRGGRKRTRQQETLRDWFSHVITLKKGMVGVKPEKFCYWLFGVLNLQPQDEFHDLFPGTGTVSSAWQKWKTNL